MRLPALLARTSAAAVLALSIFTTIEAAGAASGRATAAAAVVDTARVRIDNFGRISPAYYRGAQPEGRDYADLARLGVKMVIDLQRGGDPREQGLVEAAGMKFTRIELTTTDTPAAGDVEKFLKLVNDPVNQPVYVH